VIMAYTFLGVVALLCVLGIAVYIGDRLP